VDFDTVPHIGAYSKQLLAREHIVSVQTVLVAQEGWQVPRYMDGLTYCSSSIGMELSKESPLEATLKYREDLNNCTKCPLYSTTHRHTPNIVNGSGT